MGIPHLKGFLFLNKHFFDRKTICDMTLVFDANNLMVAAFTKLCQNKKSPSFRCDTFGGDMVAYAELLRVFFEKLHKCRVLPIMVCGGATLASHDPAQAKHLIEQAKKRATTRFDAARITSPINPGEQLAMMSSMSPVFNIVLNEFNIQRIRTPFGANNYAALIANDFDCPLVSNDSEFNLLPIRGGLILADDVLKSAINKLERIYDYGFDCKIYKQAYLIDGFGLSHDVIPLLGGLLRSSYKEKSPFDHLLEFAKNPYKGPMKVKTYDHNKIACLFTWMSKFDDFESALLDIKGATDANRAAIRDVSRAFRLSEREDLGRELELVYAPSDDYSTLDADDKPAQFLRRLLEEEDLPGSMLDLIFQSPLYEKAVIDDLNQTPSSSVRLRPFSVALALLRPKSQVQSDKNKPVQVWKFWVYDRAPKGSQLRGLVSNELEALDDLEGFGSLRDIHIGVTVQMEASMRRKLLLATFRCDETAFGQIGDALGVFFGQSFKPEAQLCFMLIRYNARESKVKPMREFIEAALITTLFYSFEPVDKDEVDDAKLAATSLVASVERHRDPEPSDQYRPIMHLISQLSAAYWSFISTNCILGHPLRYPRLHIYFNCLLMYELTNRRLVGELDFEQAFADASAPRTLIDSFDKLTKLVVG